MDSVLTDSLAVLRDSEPSDPRLFFAALGEVLEHIGEGADFDTFRTAFTDRASRDGFAESGELFVRYLESTGGAETVRKLAEEGMDNLVVEYERRTGIPDSGGAASGAYDESVWTAFVAEFGPGWNGAVDTWDAFRTWFLYHAGERGVAAPATDFLDHAENESDRVAFFAVYGVTIDTEAAEDPGAWQAFLADYGPVWNGAEENWASFTPYFLHYAGEHGVPGLAATFLENAPDDNDARVQYFASYGVAIRVDAVEVGAPEVGAAPEPVTATAISEAQQQFTQVAEESDHVPDEHEDAIAEAFAELVNQMPEAANLSREQMRELLATIPAEHL